MPAHGRSESRLDRAVLLPDGAIILPKPRMPPASLRVRLKTSQPVRRLIPTPFVVRRAEAKGSRLWREHERTRAHALRTMAAVVTGTDREPELEALAARYVVESHAWNALFWQPWPMPRIEPTSLARLHQLHKRDRGLIFSACHWGPYYAKTLVLFQFDYRPYVVSGDWYFEEPTHDWWGRRHAAWARKTPNLPLTRPKGSFDTLAAALERADEVMIYFDMPGRHETRFLGKRCALVDGTARLAAQTGALIVPIRTVREGPRQRFEVAEPLDPLLLGDVDAIHDELARFHEGWILEDPAAMADPSEFGWGSGATAAGWDRPAQKACAGGR
jgi:lauroyl/myristoyl acyltransferase